MEYKENPLIKELKPILVEHFKVQNDNSEIYDKESKQYCEQEIKILSRDVETTIDAVEHFTVIEFYLLTEVWHKVVAKTHSQKLANVLIDMIESECNNLAEYQGLLEYAAKHDDV